MNFETSIAALRRVVAPAPFDYRYRDWYGVRCDVPDMRRPIHSGELGLLEHYSISAEKASLKGYSPDHQFVMPVFGAMSWHVTGAASHVDVNTGLFIRAGEEFSEKMAIPGVGHSALIFTFSENFLDELQASRSPLGTTVFSADTQPASADAQLFAHSLICGGSLMEPLEVEERAVALMREFTAPKNPSPQNGTKRIIDRTKEILYELDCEPLSLSEVAKQIGVTPIYLTQAFKKAEGIPLYRYQSRLRMARALAEIPFVDSFIDLAMDLGYSSHSHFAAVFRSTFGVTPSAYRDEVRSGA